MVSPEYPQLVGAPGGLVAFARSQAKLVDEEGVQDKLYFVAVLRLDLTNNAAGPRL